MNDLVLWVADRFVRRQAFPVFLLIVSLFYLVTTAIPYAAGDCYTYWPGGRTRCGDDLLLEIIASGVGLVVSVGWLLVVRSRGTGRG